MTFTLHPKEVEVYTAQEVRAVWQVVKNQSRLHFLLMLNCGMLAKDINDLRQDEVDWDRATLTRKRSKTKKHQDVPTVTYKLWPETFQELKTWRSADPEIVLLTTSGGRWIVGHQREDSYHRSDCIRSAMRVYLKLAKVNRPLKAFRATASSKLGEHPSYKFFQQYFLGQSPKTVTDKHYYKPADKEFFEALDWLRGEMLG
jgi:integrase